MGIAFERDHGLAVLLLVLDFARWRQRHDMVKLEHELHLHAYRQGGASRIFDGSLVLEDYLSGFLGNWESFVFDDGAYRVPRGNCYSSHND